MNENKNMNYKLNIYVLIIIVFFFYSNTHVSITDCTVFFHGFVFFTTSTLVEGKQGLKSIN